MPLSPGARVGPYEIVAPIGAGGMGEVYRARDARLDRDVAIKILPPAFASDSERLARFEREARVLASLNHPNIAQVYGVEEAAGSRALVMEFVEGDDLAQRLARGPMPVADVIRVARQIAQALDAAHERGIIHRDLKPANIKVRDDGAVKVLDFGLAKAVEPAGGSASHDQMNSPTITSPATQIGTILGTAAYMAPEQAKGKPVDKRADIWAFGCVVYEMLTAKRAFAGSDVSETLASVLARDVDWSALPADTPPSLRALMRACLQKDRRDRLRDLGDAWLHADAADAAVAPAQARRPAVIPWAVSAVALVAAAMLGVKAFRTEAPESLRLSIALPDGHRVTAGPIISPDGRRIIFGSSTGVGESKLYLRDLNGFELRELPGTEDAGRPFMSPSGRWIGFFARGALFRLDLEGGAPVRLADAPASGGGTWGDDDAIVFVPQWNGGLYRIDARGGEPSLLIKPDPAKKEYAYTSPHFLPGGREVLFSSWGVQFSVDRLELAGLTRAKAAPGYWAAATKTSSGHLLVPANQGDLLALPYPPSESATATAVLSKVHWLGRSGDGAMKFAVSQNGTLVFAPGDMTARSLVIVDENGRVAPLSGERSMLLSASVSPDGRRAAASRDGQIVVIDLDRGTVTPVSSRAGGAQAGEAWSTDGSRLFFGDNSDGNWEIYEAIPGRAGSPARVLQRPLDQFPMSVAPDGTLLFLEATPGMGGNLWMRAPNGDVTAWLGTSADESQGVFSPDGALIAYVSNASGRREVYVQPRETGAAAMRVSANGGGEPRWSPSGDRLFFREGNLMVAADVVRRPVLSIGRPRVLFDGGWQLEADTPYSVMPDGKRFLMVRFEPAAIPTRLDIITNWFEELRRRVPIR